MSPHYVDTITVSTIIIITPTRDVHNDDDGDNDDQGDTDD